MLPELFKIPIIDFTVSTYGLMLATALLFGLWLAARLAARDGYESAKVYDIGLYMLVTGLLGSKVLMIFTEWSEFVNNPARLFSLEFLRSAGVYYGGLLSAVGISIYLARRYSIPWWSFADACAPGIAIGQFFGRLGCFAAGCCWGKPTTSWIGVQFTARAHELTGVPIDMHLHPTQLYESLTTLLITGILLYVHKRRQFRGQVILCYAALYSLARFSMEFLRDDPRGSLLGVSTSQLVSLIIGPIAVAALIYRWRHAKKTTTATGAQLSEQPS
ncbi:MAG: prolipoprotein diacylglyceryl transferase [Acidobacteriota bacterium]